MKKIISIFLLASLAFGPLKGRLPEGPTNMYTCMDYRTLTNKASDQWQLQTECFTDAETGIRYYECNEEIYYCAALGDAYGEIIGDTWTVTLECGTQFNIIRSDFKDEYGKYNNFFGHPCKNYDGEACTNVIEFVVDMDYVPKKVKLAGTMSALDEFGGLFGDGGNIVEMKYTGRKWI